MKAVMLRVTVVLTMTLAVLLGGCCKPVIEKKIVYQDKLVYVKPPETMLTKVKPDTPPDMDEFANMTEIERMNTLTEYVISVLGSLKEANIKLGKLSKWSDKQEHAVENNVSK